MKVRRYLTNNTRTAQHKKKLLFFKKKSVKGFKMQRKDQHPFDFKAIFSSENFLKNSETSH